MKFDATGDVEYQLDLLLNQGLELSENLKGALLEVDLQLGENTVSHGLGVVPIGYIVLYKSAAEAIYGSRVNEWTTEVLYLQSDVASQTARLFVL